MIEELTEHLKGTFDLSFQQNKLLQEAFTHSSYVNEHRNESLNDNERLEFLGDAVLELTVSDYLYHKYPEFPEGLLTRMRAAIVCEASLSRYAKECRFDEYVRLGKGEERMNGRNRPALLCDLFESFIGALYLEQGVDEVRRFLEKTIFPEIDSGAFSHGMDYKTELQEFLQQKGEVNMVYTLIDEIGPAHQKEFVVEVVVEGHVLGTGKGTTKKGAEQAAAQNALVQLRGN
ncbi:ribonuclease III [Atopococcus tabaci]|uniref:ribonuclease III n=1 Tax=Atopococcus tabaci TaxID=269774 RepID=UPI0003FF4A02|nr:ribonuclease III [Atopococcus tabaci]